MSRKAAAATPLSLPVPDLVELAEQHPELRLRPVSTDEIHAYNGITWTDELGAYEWWEISALDATGSGLLCSLHVGNAFDPAYRRHVRQLRAGRFVEPMLGRKSATAAIRVALFNRGRLIARSHIGIDPDHVRETAVASGWSLHFGENHLTADGDGWILHLNVPRTPTGLQSVVKRSPVAGGRIKVDLQVQPRFHTQTFFRGFLPDSPSGASHDWLPACPCASVTGTMEWAGGKGGAEKFELNNADGSVDHFRGSGPIGEGIRRYYIARVAWPGGAAIGELIVIRKYIQLAPSLMIFTADEPPRIIRGDRTPRADFQRSAWLLGYPLSLGWLSERDGIVVEHEMDRLADASPYRTAAISRCRVQIDSAAREVRLEDHPGLVQLIQPPRIDGFPWRLWSGPMARPQPASGGE